MADTVGFIMPLLIKIFAGSRGFVSFQPCHPATALAKSVARLEDGSPASPVGELIDVIVKEVETSNQPNSQGSADSDVQAEKSQAKEGAWELFTG